MRPKTSSRRPFCAPFGVATGSSPARTSRPGVHILRNDYLSDLRKRKREVEDADGSYAATLISIPEQPGHLDLQDFHEALAKLPAEMRQAIMLVGAEGQSYEQAAETLNVAVGTIKSRVNRARAKLAELLQFDGSDPGGGRLAAS